MTKRLIIALLAVIGLALSWVAISAWQGRGHDGATWSRTYRSHAVIVPVGPHAWIAPYNEGTGYLMQERFADATPKLKTALRKVGKATPDASGSIGGSDECRVRMNLSLALEGEARQLSGDAARTLMTEAAETSRPCTTDGVGGEGSTSPEDLIHQRQRAAAAPEKDKPTDEPSEEPSEDPGEGTAPPSKSPEPEPTLDSKQDQLEENQRRSEEELRQREERKGEGFGSGEAW
ncbi:hypothetical protein [Bowdeniella nasicola]|uniref:hypothetical protein n=1 Tax=Bowdeniella nasicola TaxID=208480 RepID=UPI0011611DE7|nr:hypothetical protein [Bowdeniella nasicola]